MSIITKAIIEIPQGSYYKYEQDKSTGGLVLDRVLLQPYPYNYGYIPHTLWDDGDPLDVFVIGDQSIHPLTSVSVEILGILRCTDNGESDDKLLAKIVGDPFPEVGTDIIIKFLTTYKEGFSVDSIDGIEEAQKALHKAYANKV